MHDSASSEQREAGHESCLGAGAAVGDDDSIELDAKCVLLVGDLQRALGVAETRERRTGTGRQDVAQASMGRERRLPLSGEAGGCSGVGQRMDHRPEQIGKQRIAAPFVLNTVVRRERPQPEFATQPESCGRRRGQPRTIRLARAGGDDGVGATSHRVAEKELKLAQLAAAATQPGQVVALDEQANAVQRGPEGRLDPAQPLDRRRPFEQPGP